MVSTGSFASYLARLDEATLVALLRLRADARAEPVPRGFAQLAERLSLPNSLGTALCPLGLDLHTAGQAVAVLGADATDAAVARMLGVPEAVVAALVDRLCRRGLAWRDGATVRLPERLAAHWAAGIGGGRTAAQLGKTMLVDQLRECAAAHGVAVAGLRKAELVEALGAAMSDWPALVARVERLPAQARAHLEQILGVTAEPDDDPGYVTSFRPRGPSSVTEQLIRAGLMVRCSYAVEVPREVAVAVWLATGTVDVAAPPILPPADRVAAPGAATGAALELVRALTTVLDDAATKPVTALKKGGVGTRERTRLATRLELSEQVVTICLDLAHAAGLLDATDSGYAPTAGYADWRDAEPGHRWAVLAHTWLALEWAPTYRLIDDDREQPPPVPLASAAGIIRRAMLVAARGGASVAAAGRHVDWFAPAHGYPAADARLRVDAAIREAELLGVVVADALSELGAHLVAVTNVDVDPPGHTDGDPRPGRVEAGRIEDSADPDSPDPDSPDPVADLAARCAPLLPAAGCTVILQSDLTAVVSGQPSAATAGLLALAAVAESRGAAGIWRFTPASIRAALDSGTPADSLRADLAAISARPLPQPLDYLITDVARRHGHIRVRGMRSCVVTDETTATELEHTRRLAKLHLARLAPTVLSSPMELDEVLAALRAAGFAPLAEDATGTVIVERRDERRATRPGPPVIRRSLMPATVLAARLRAEGDASTGEPHPAQSEVAATRSTPG